LSYGVFGLALATLRGLIRLVDGVGAVVVLHSPTTMTAQPRNLPSLRPHVIT
jgi:hypothetical protein